MNKYQKQQITRHYNPNILAEVVTKMFDYTKPCPRCAGFGEDACSCFTSEHPNLPDETRTCKLCQGWGWIYTNGSVHYDELDNHDREVLIAFENVTWHIEAYGTLSRRTISCIERWQSLSGRKVFDTASMTDLVDMLERNSHVEIANV